MRGKLAVSDLRLQLVFVLALPDLTAVGKAQVPFRPGKLAKGGFLYCADAEGAGVHALDVQTLAVERSFVTGPEIEALALSQSGMALYVLSGGADSLQVLDTSTGRLDDIIQVGMRPRGFTHDETGRFLAVAAGDTAEVVLIDTQTMRIVGTFLTDGVATGVCFLGGVLIALCSQGEYDMRTLVGAFGKGGKWSPLAALSGMPGAIAPCGGGILVGHYKYLTMLEPVSGRIRWQTKIAGLPTEIIPVGRAACFIDALEGTVGLIDLRRGTLLRRMTAQEPRGLVLL